jgi:hypothetical protein
MRGSDEAAHALDYKPLGRGSSLFFCGANANLCLETLVNRAFAFQWTASLGWTMHRPGGFPARVNRESSLSEYPRACFQNGAFAMSSVGIGTIMEVASIQRQSAGVASEPEPFTGELAPCNPRHDNRRH